MSGQALNHIEKIGKLQIIFNELCKNHQKLLDDYNNLLQEHKKLLNEILGERK